MIEASVHRINEIALDSNIDHEILVVNDGSTDRTLEILKTLQKRVPLRIINLSKNSGHMSAIRAGMEASGGEYVLTIDADLQDPPEVIPELFHIMKTPRTNDSGQLSGTWDVIQTFRADRSSDSFWKRISASMYYSIIEKITGVSVIPHAADFRIMRRKVVDTLISLPEKNLVYRLLIPKLGFQIKPFPITRNERFAGKSKYTNAKMIGLAIDSVIGFTNRPLRILALTGIFASLLLLFGSICTLLFYLFGETIPGWPSLVLLILSFNAFLFAGIGLVGEYVGRIYQLVQARPAPFWEEVQ